MTNVAVSTQLTGGVFELFFFLPINVSRGGGTTSPKLQIERVLFCRDINNSLQNSGESVLCLQFSSLANSNS